MIALIMVVVLGLFMAIFGLWLIKDKWLATIGIILFIIGVVIFILSFVGLIIYLIV